MRPLIPVFFEQPVPVVADQPIVEGSPNFTNLGAEVGDIGFDIGIVKSFSSVTSSPKMKLWFTPAEIMVLVTSNNARLLALSGPRNPYQAGPLGEIREGAYADLILVDGNPLEGIDIVVDHENNFDLIMKDGVIYKNSLED